MYEEREEGPAAARLAFLCFHMIHIGVGDEEAVDDAEAEFGDVHKKFCGSTLAEGG